jgi:glutamyl-tRNA synthetase
MPDASRRDPGPPGSRHSPSPPRVRFCPAPSGWLHVGSARTALFNWLHARHTGGTFVLRIEDTDAQRATEGSMRGMIASLRFLGLDWDEGPEIGGEYGPYRQSARAALYTATARRLLEAGHAYEAFETADELAAARAEAESAGRPPGYGGGHRDLSDAQRAAYRRDGRQPVLRLRTPDEGSTSFDDVVRGPVEVAWKDVPDFVVQRANGTATYYLANTTDDLAQGITFVARGEDLLSATPRQRVLADRLLADDGHGGTILDAALAEVGFPSRPEVGSPLTYAHLPLLVGPDRKKLSKRHGSVAIDEFGRQGFLPEVLVNFLAMCGWSYDDRTERFTVPELIERFTFDRVGSNPASFDTDKLRALNGDRIKELAVDELGERLVPAFVEAGAVGDPPSEAQRALIGGFAPLLQERIQTLAEAVPLVAWAFRDEVTYDEQAVAKHLKGRAGEVLALAAERLAALDVWTAEGIFAVFDEIMAALEIGRGKAMQPVRVAVVGTSVSPPLPETLALLDRDVVISRIRAARDHVQP